NWFLRTAAVFSTTTAVSWYLSILIHIVTYGVAAGIFYLVGAHLDVFQDDRLLQATLGEEDVIDDAAQLIVMKGMPTNNVAHESTLEQAANSLQTRENGWIDSNSIDLMSSASTAAGEQVDEDVTGVLLKIPESGLAVTRGSFTAWTVPENPTPYTSYQIIIEYRLPDDVKRIYLSDIRGTIRGTDGHEQKIPYDDNYAYAAVVNGQPVKSSSQTVKPVNHKIQLIVQVPGATKALVQDTIKIRSNKLRESQELILTFRKFDSDIRKEQDDSDR
ncbi:MAG: hypothetical protein KDA85_07695, partial [Planctomycetaceae bacterium]|nr:hypothetical protein [Planctomycetaceae bacterium]